MIESMQSSLFMYLAAMSAVSLHNLANNIKEATSGHRSIDLRTASAGNWTLSEPAKLYRAFPQCNATRQSPIELSSKSARENPDLRLGLTAYERPVVGLLVNQFPTFRLVPLGGGGGGGGGEWSRPSALVSQSKARLSESLARFSLSHVEFHWLPGLASSAAAHGAPTTTSPTRPSSGGQVWPRDELGDYNGSLHLIDGAAHAAELHFVHLNAAYSGREQALGQPDGQLILAVPVAASSHESYLIERLLAELTNLTEHLQHAALAEESTWRSLLPQDTSRFYRYFGSDWLPPCSQSVQWIVFEDKLKLGYKQLARLARLRFLARQQDTGRQVDWARQLRPLQPLGDRCVERSFRLGAAAAPLTRRSARARRGGPWPTSSAPIRAAAEKKKETPRRSK